MPKPPTVPPDQLRKLTLGLAVTPAEAATYRQLADDHGISVSNLLRNLLTERPLPKPRTPKTDRDTAEQLRRIGSNLNQAVRASNQGQIPIGAPDTLRDLQLCLVAILRELRK